MRHKRANKKKTTNKEILIKRLESGESIHNYSDSLGMQMYVLSDEAWDIQFKYIMENAETEIKGILRCCALRQQRDFYKNLMYGVKQ